MILRFYFSIVTWSTWATSASAFVIGLNSSRIQQVEDPNTRGKLTEIYVIVEVPPPEDQTEDRNKTDTTTIPIQAPMPPQGEVPEEVVPDIKQPEETNVEPEPPKKDEPSKETEPEPEPEAEPEPEPEPPEILGGGPSCGNGVVDEGEECDCGDRCPRGEDGNPVSCCDMRTCRWAEVEAVCDHHDPLQPCCQSCHFAPSITLCRPSKGECDPLEEFCTGTSSTCPPDKFTRNLTPCANGELKCASGICTSRDSWCQLSSGISLESLFGESPSIISGYCPTSSDGVDPASEEYSKAMQLGCRVDCQIHYEADRQWNEIESICIPAAEGSVQVFPDGTDCSDDTYGAGSCLDGICIRTASLPQPDPNKNRFREPPSEPEPSPTTPKATIIAATLSSVFALILILVLVRYLRRRRKRTAIHSSGSEQGDSQLDLIIDSINAAQKQKLQARSEVRQLRYVPSCERIERMPTVWEVDSREGSEVGEKAEGGCERAQDPDEITVIPESGDLEKRVNGGEVAKAGK